MKVDLASPATVIPSCHLEPKVFCGRLPGDMRGAAPEEPVGPQRTNLEPVACDNDLDTMFLDDLCQEIRMLLRTPASYPKVFRDLTILYHMARLSDEPVHTAEWRARFRLDQIARVYKSIAGHITYASQIALLQTYSNSEKSFADFIPSHHSGP
jgi:hypothetical protein